MAETYKGLTIRIGADTTSLQNALKASDRAIKDTQKQLRLLEKAANLNPTSMRALSGRVEEAAAQALNLTRRFQTCQTALTQLRSSVPSIDKLAASTKDAAYQAEDAQEKYAAIVAKIKAYKNAIASLHSEDFNPNKTSTDPFAGLEVGSDKVIAKMKELGASEKEIVGYTKLVKEYFDKLNTLDLAKKVKSFKELKTQLAVNGAEAKSLYIELAKIQAQNSAVTQTAEWRRCADAIRSMDSAAASVNNRMYALGEAFNLDRTDLTTAVRYLKSMQDAIDANVTQLNLLNSQLDQLKAKGADKTVASVKNLATELEKAKREVAELEAEFDGVATGSITLTDDEVEKLNAQLTEAKTRLNTLAEGNEFQELSTQMATLTAKTNSLNEKLKGTSNTLERVRGSVQQFGWSMYSTATPMFTMFASKAIESAQEIDTAYRNMRKTVQGTEEQFESLKQAAMDYSRTNFTSADTLLEIEAMGGQLGVATSKLDSFATAVSSIEIATDLDADTASEQLGQLSAILNDMSQDDFEKYGDALVRLGNNNATLESKISDVMLRIASMGTITGFSTTQLLAWSTAVAATGQGAEAAGTAISKTMSDIESAVSGGGDSLDAFAKVAGMSASEFANAWETTPSAAMQAFIEGLNRIEEEGGSADATLGELGITSVRQKQSILGLMQTIDGLNNNLTMSEDAWNGVSDEWGAAGDAAREAERKAEGFSGAVQMLSNNMQVLGAEMGESLTPVIQALTQVVAALTQAYSDAPDVVKHLINIMVLLVAALGPATVATSAVLNAWKSLKKELAERSAYKQAIAQVEADTAAKQVNTVATEEKTVATKTDTTATKTNTTATKAGTVATKAGTVATKAFGTAMKAIPWIAALSVATELIGAIGDYIDHANTASKATEGMKAAINSFETEGVANSLATVTTSVKDVADEALKSQAELVDQAQEAASNYQGSASKVNEYVGVIKELAGNTGDSTEKQEKLALAVNGLNDICGTNYQIIDKVNGVLDTSTDTIDDNTEAWKKNAKAQAVKELFSSTQQQIIANEQALDQVNKRMKEIEDSTTSAFDGYNSLAGRAEHGELKTRQKELTSAIEEGQSALEYYNGLMEEGTATTGEYADATGEATGSTDGLTDSTDSANSELETLVENLTTLCDNTPVLQQAISETGLSTEEFAQRMTDAGLTVDELSSKIETYTTTATDAFSRITGASELSLDEMLENMQYNTETTQNWADNIKYLYSQCANDSERAFVDKLAELGVEYSSQVQALTDDAETYLPQFAAAMDTGTQAAVDAATANINELPSGITSAEPEVDAAAGEVANTIEQQLGGAVDASDGTDMIQNFASGMVSQSSLSAVTGAVVRVSGVVSKFLEHSIPKEGILHNNGKGEAEWGRHLVENFGLGIEQQIPVFERQVAALPRAVADAYSQAQRYIGGNTSMQYEVASSITSRGVVGGTKTESIITNNYVVNGMNYLPDSMVAQAVENVFTTVAKTQRMGV